MDDCDNCDAKKAAYEACMMRESTSLSGMKYFGSGAIVGAAFWGWAGEGRKAHGLWQPGDEFIAETPSEYQGWNSVYDSDFSTTRIVTRFADTFAENLALAVGIPSGPSRK